jgi:hypothetical protein
VAPSGTLGRTASSARTSSDRHRRRPRLQTCKGGRDASFLGGWVRVAGKGIKHCVQKIGHPPAPRNAEKNSKGVTARGEDVI